jgi:uncharacterized protein (TIGR01244 family)
MIQLEPGIFVSGQIAPDDVAAAANAGIRTIINNRPDGEEPGQPADAEIEAAAKAAGLGYRHIPVSGGFSEAQVAAMADALDEGPALAFCRSGTRSTCLWALARARQGRPAESILEAAAAAGYDLRPIAAYLQPR